MNNLPSSALILKRAVASETFDRAEEIISIRALHVRRADHLIFLDVHLPAFAFKAIAEFAEWIPATKMVIKDQHSM
jgi:hypothetical protein